ncbi:ABC transporter permease [Aurantiacibacter gangjinensis]|uniref:Multidrug ABC transporter substrate-binding protein n=1 Tax=Aurantiacibacter gangjinensis TaxID=502682 RepID=A0A0G9MNM2_9SPHN|nr:ABC transporter permease [Aurantiacibacter gangjinensis]KLE32305.1 multidrug ABC transporter substrate-binding protein [Aurantiacibacter gangjinensis]
MVGATVLLALREIKRHLLRSFLTTLGIIIGVAAVITMVTLGQGLTADVQEDISGLGSDVFIVFPSQVSPNTPPPPFERADILAVQNQIAGVEYAAGSVSRSATAFHNGQDWQTSVQGAERAFFDAQNIEVVEGRRFNDEEETRGESVCIIGPTVAEKIFIEGQIVGEEMRIGNVACRVIGVTEERSSSGGGDANDVVFMPLTAVQRRFTGNNNLQYFVVKYDPDFNAQTLQDQLVALLRERRVIQEGEENNFNLVDTAEISDTVNQITGTMTLVVTVIAGISLLVGGIGIMNIMLVSVTERTREIGIRLAIGALAKEVRLQFLTEAVVLCCFGGLIGILLALGLSVMLAGAIDLPFIFNPAVNVMSFVFSAVMGIIFGYYPAHRASKLDPIDALRHE